MNNEQSAIDLTKLHPFANDCGHAFNSQGSVEYCLIEDFVSNAFLEKAKSLNFGEFEAIEWLELTGQLHCGESISLLDQLMAMEGLLPDPHFSFGGPKHLQGSDSLSIPSQHEDYRLTQKLSLILSLENRESKASLLIKAPEQNTDFELGIKSGMGILLRNSGGVSFHTHSPKATRLFVAHFYAQPNKQQ